MTETNSYSFRDPAVPLDERIEDLIGRLTLEEKVSQMAHESAAIDRLGIPAYNWWNECLHGVGRAGRATVFPQAIGLAATFNTDLIHRIGVTTSDEARAKHHAASRLHNGASSHYMGLTYWSPNINIFRDPRWGRGHETYGEDPCLTGAMAIAFVRGLQGPDPDFLKLAAAAKHFAVHSGPENDRHHFDAVVSAKDLWETYLPAFEQVIRNGDVEAVMTAYNRTNGEPCAASPTLIQDILRGTMGFKGHVLSDCGSLEDLHGAQKVTANPAESAALALNTGVDLNCGCTYPHLVEAAAQGLTDEATIDKSLARLLATRFRLGMFDPPETIPYAAIPESVVACDAHRALSRKAAQESIVLLKNNGVLPLEKDIRSLYIIGPNSESLSVLLGNYHGYSASLVSVLEGIVGAISPGTKVQHLPGCGLNNDTMADPDDLEWQLQDFDVVIAVMGLAPALEGEEGEGAGASGGDRSHIDLPGRQEELLKLLKDLGKKIVLVLTGGSALAVNWAQEHADAIIDVWYPGEEGGNALADVLFGDVSPAGRLPITFYRSLDDVPDFSDYAMAGRTYRYFEGEPLYPFGFGLSYTVFEYRDLELERETVAAGESLTVTVEVCNTGERDGDDVVQIYLAQVAPQVPGPRHQLVAFARVTIAAGAAATLTFVIAADQMTVVDENGDRRHITGTWRLIAGGCSPGDRGSDVGAASLIEMEFRTTEG